MARVAYELRHLDTGTGDVGPVLAVVSQDGEGAEIVVEGDSPEAEELRERAGTPYNETVEALLHGYQRYAVLAVPGGGPAG